MTGGFLGQRQRGRTQGVRGVRCGRAAAAVWIGLFMLAGLAGAQQVQSPSPASTPPPARTPVVGSGANAATPAETQQSPPAGTGETQTTADAGLSTTVWEWKGLRVDKI